MSKPYDGVFFTISMFLVLGNRLAGMMLGAILLVTHNEKLSVSIPPWKYFAISCSSMGSSYCQYDALKYVSLPLQVMAKSFKMMPVMLWGRTISGRRYPHRDWIVAAVVTTGVSICLLCEGLDRAHSKSNTWYGLVLLTVFLVLDGFTSSYQEKLFTEQHISKYHLMLYVNIGSAFLCSVDLILSDTFLPAIKFCRAHPSFAHHFFLLSVVATVSQFFIFSLVQEFGALSLAATLNVRQIVSVLVSYIMFAHVITLPRVVGIMLVFGALLYKTVVHFKETPASLPTYNVQGLNQQSAQTTPSFGTMKDLMSVHK